MGGGLKKGDPCGSYRNNPVKGNNELDQGIAAEGVRGRWIFLYILTVESRVGAGGYDLGCERKVKNDCKGFVTAVKMALSPTELGKTTG